MLGLALGGGAARGFAHIGVAQVLLEIGLTPQVYAGSSMGALVGAFLAAGHSPQGLEELAERLSPLRLLDWRPGHSLLRAEALGRWLEGELPATFEELRFPLTVTATDLVSGRGLYFSHGELIPALLASSAYPGFSDPLRRGDTLLADGGIVNQVPVDAVAFMGATRTVAVNVTAPAALSLPERRFSLWRGGPLSPLRSLRRAADIMQASLTDARLSLYPPDVLITPDLGDLDLMSFRRAAEAVAAGRHAAKLALPQLRALQEQPPAPPE